MHQVVGWTVYQGHSEIIDTPLAFWTLGEIKTSARSKGKREDWTGREREKVGQLCPSTETGAVQGGAMVNFTYLIKQSMTASSRKAIVLPKNVPEMDPTSNRYSSLSQPKIEDWISLSSGHHDSILKETLNREQVGRVWKWVILICVGFKAIPDLLSTIFFYTLATIDYFFSYFNLIILSTCYSPLFSKLRESTQGMAVLSRRKVDDSLRATLR